MMLTLDDADLRVLWEILEFHRDDEDDQVPYDRNVYWALLDKLNSIAAERGWITEAQAEADRSNAT